MAQMESDVTTTGHKSNDAALFVQPPHRRGTHCALSQWYHLFRIQTNRQPLLLRTAAPRVIPHDSRRMLSSAISKIYQIRSAVAWNAAT